MEKPCSLVMNFYEKVVRICWKYLILLRRGSPGLLCLEKAPGGGGSSEQNATILFDCLFILFEKSESKSSSPKFSPITLNEQNKAIMQLVTGSCTENATILFDCLFILFEKSESKSSSPIFSPITLKEQNKAIMQWGIHSFVQSSKNLNNLNVGSREKRVITLLFPLKTIDSLTMKRESPE